MSKILNGKRTLLLIAICLSALFLSAGIISVSADSREIKELPTISAEFEIKYTKVNEAAKLPSFRAYCSGDDIAATAKMLDVKGEEIDVSDGFTPTAAGEYHYIVSAVSKSGETVEKDIVYYVEETDAYKNKMASFDKPYGLNQIGLTYGMVPSYSTDRAYLDEDGSLKLQVDTRYARSESQFAFGNFHIKDVSKDKEVYFYVYNDTDSRIKLCFNWVGATTLRSKRWTEVRFTHDELLKLSNGANAFLSSKFSSTSMDGLNVNLVASTDTPYIFDLYFSAMYVSGISAAPSAAECDRMITLFSASEFDFDTAEEIQTYYDGLSDEEKDKVTLYSNFFGSIKSTVGAALNDKGENEILCLDKEIGRRQFIKVEGADLSYTTVYHAEGETGSTQIKTFEFDAKLYIGFPATDSLRGFKQITFSMYNPLSTSVYLHNEHNQRIGASSSVEIKPRQWTQVTFDISGTDTLVGCSLWLYSGNWSKALDVGSKFYISGVYGVPDENFLEPQEMKSAIDALPSKADVTYEYLVNIKNNYDGYQDDEKALVTNYNSFIAFAKEFILSDTQTADGKLVYFGSEAGEKQVEFSGCVSESGSYDIGGETIGATKITSNDFDVKIKLLFVDEYDGVAEALNFFVFNANDTDYILFNQHGDNRIGEKGEYVLKSNEWTRISLPLEATTKFINGTLWIYSGDWNLPFGEGKIFYLTDLETGAFQNENAGTVIPSENAVIVLSGEGATEHVSGTQATYSLSKRFIYKNQGGALRVSIADFYADITLLSNVDLEKFEYFEFAVYNPSPVEKAFIDFLTGETEIKLAPGSWTVIRLPIGNLSTLNGVKMRLFSGDWNISASGNNFYISDIIGIPIEIDEDNVEVSEDAIIIFSQESGVQSVSSTQADLKYTKKQRYGNEGGSLKIQVTDYFADISLINNINLWSFDYIQFYVYNPSTVDKGFIDFFSTADPNGNSIVLKAGSWTKITLPVTNLDILNGKTIRFYSGDWNFPAKGSFFYLSDIVGIKAENQLGEHNQDTIINIASQDAIVSFTSSQATLTKSKEQSVSNQRASLKVKVTDFYADLAINSTLDITDYSYIEFYVFNLSNVDKGFVDFFTPSESGETQIVLKANMWTKIRLPTSSLTTLNGKKLRLYMGNWNDSTIGSEFYISDIVGIQ